MLSGSLSAIANPSDQFWVSPAIGLVLARGSVTIPFAPKTSEDMIMQS